MVVERRAEAGREGIKEQERRHQPELARLHLRDDPAKRVVELLAADLALRLFEQKGRGEDNRDRRNGCDGRGGLQRR